MLRKGDWKTTEGAIAFPKSPDPSNDCGERKSAGGGDGKEGIVRKNAVIAGGNDEDRSWREKRIRGLLIDRNGAFRKRRGVRTQHLQSVLI